MRRLMLGAAALAMVIGQASGAGARPSASCGTVPVGHYNVFVDWQGIGHHRFPMSLRANGKGTAAGSNTIVWTLTGSDFEMSINDGVAHYSGSPSHLGLNTTANPGTMTSISGDSGTWHARKVCP